MRTTESPVNTYRQQNASKLHPTFPRRKCPEQHSAAGQLTSHKQHLALLLHRAHLAIAALVLFVDSVNRLFHLAEHQVAMAVVCLVASIPVSTHHPRPSGVIVSHGGTHVKPSLQLTVSPQLHKHHLVQRQADQIERLVDRVGGGAGFFGRSHSASFSLRRASVCGKLFCWVVVIEMHGSADVLARLSTNSLSDVGAYSNCERLEFRFCPVPASGCQRAATSGQCKSNGYGNINGTAHPHSHIALTLQAPLSSPFPRALEP